MEAIIEIIYSLFFVDPQSTNSDKPSMKWWAQLILFSLLCFTFVFFAAERFISELDSVGNHLGFIFILLALFIVLWIIGSYKIIKKHRNEKDKK